MNLINFPREIIKKLLKVNPNEIMFCWINAELEEADMR